MLEVFEQNQGRVVSCCGKSVEQVPALSAGDQRIGAPVEDKKWRRAGAHVMHRVGGLYFAARGADGHAEQPRLERLRMSRGKHVADSQAFQVVSHRRGSRAIGIDPR